MDLEESTSNNKLDITQLYNTIIKLSKKVNINFTTSIYDLVEQAAEYMENSFNENDDKKNVYDELNWCFADALVNTNEFIKLNEHYDDLEDYVLNQHLTGIDTYLKPNAKLMERFPKLLSKLYSSKTIRTFDDLLKYAKENYCINDIVLNHDFMSVFFEDEVLVGYMESILKDNFITLDDAAKVLKEPDIMNTIKRRLYNSICTEYTTDLIPDSIYDMSMCAYKVELKSIPKFLNDYKKFCINCNTYDEDLIHEIVQILKDLADNNHFDSAMFYDKAIHPKKFIDVNDDDKIGSSVVVSSISPINFASAGRTSPLVIIGDNVLTGSASDHHDDLITAFKTKKYKELTGKELPKEIDEATMVGYDQGYDKVLNLLQESTVGVGSIFGKVALLEFITGKLPDKIIEGKAVPNSGNIDCIKNALKNAGYTKVYINLNGAWTSRKYLRIAKPRLFRKIYG